jgi:hypothetical protein
MSKKRKGSKPAPPTDVSEETSPPTIHEAELASGPSGAVLRGPEIDIDAAVARRKSGLDVVVCGSKTKANGDLARQIEEAAVRPGG